MPRASMILAGIAIGVVLAGCKPAPEMQETIRPVLTKVVALQTTAADRFAGEVVARYESELGFRAFGRVVSRSVGIGNTVEPGQQIAQLDSTEQELAVRTAEANLASAQAQLNNLRAVEQRQEALLQQSNISPAVFESAQQATRTGQSSVAQAQAQLDKAIQQLGYTTLRAEQAGLVTAIAVEPGQTVAVGETIVTIVQPEIREAVISVIESDARSVAVGDVFTITKQLDPTLTVIGTVREVSPQADPTTRTVTVRIAMDDSAGKFRLGSTIIATRSEDQLQDIIVPGTSVFQDEAGTNVWVVDTNSQTVNKRPVTAEQQTSGDFVVMQGLAVGALVVTAGVHSLTEGQQVGSIEGRVN